jgi:putative hemolysin
MEFVILLVLILVNGLFAMSEIAIVSSRKARLQQRIDAGSSGAKLALRLADDPGKLLSTVQVGITTIGILSGAFGENAIAERLITVFNAYPALVPYSQAMATVIMVVVITFFSVVLGELVPKRLALLNPESIATLIARPMDLLSRLAHPLVALFSLASTGLLRLLGAKAPDGPPVTEEEIKVMLQQGADAGVFEASEQTMVGNVFRLDDLRVTAIMTPRLDITYLDLDDTEEENLATLALGRFQTLPVCRGGMDHLLGLLDAKDYLGRMLKGQEPRLEDLVHPALFVPETITPNQLLATLRRQRSYVALVVDEYGSVEGMVTLTDLLEAIIGDLPGAESDSDDAVQREDGSWLLDGMLPLDRLTALFELTAPLDDDEGDYHTLGGFIMAALGRVPAVGDHFEHKGLRFEVMDMDRNRVDRVLVQRVVGA